MSATIIYDGNEIGTLEGGQTATLNCEGQVMRSNLVIEHNGVESVNGKTGAVTLTASDVGALPSNTTIPTKVSQLTNDKNYISSYTETDPTVPSWAKATSKPSYTKSEVGLGNVDNVKQYSASNPPPYPVTKVNNKTGAVTLTASDVGAVSSVYFEEYEEDFADMQTTLRDKLDKTTYNALLNKAETWTFTLADGSTVTKKVVLA